MRYKVRKTYEYVVDCESCQEAMGTLSVVDPGGTLRWTAVLTDVEVSRVVQENDKMNFVVEVPIDEVDATRSAFLEQGCTLRTMERKDAIVLFLRRPEKKGGASGKDS